MILKVNGKYFLWSSIVDSPTSYAMTLEELTEYYREEYGRRGVEDELPRSLARADEFGTSSMVRKTVKECMWLNRAGKNETALTYTQILRLVFDHEDEIEGMDLSGMSDAELNRRWTPKVFDDEGR